MKVELHKPASKQVLTDALGLAGVQVDDGAVDLWTPLEQALAFDWALREHLGASDNPIQRRPKPSFVTAAQPAGG